MDPIEFMYIVTVAAAMGEAIPPVKVIFKEVKE